MKQLKADFCVVGAGYAGLAAAYQLQKKQTDFRFKFGKQGKDAAVVQQLLADGFLI